jgi:hypothetical protein
MEWNGTPYSWRTPGVVAGFPALTCLPAFLRYDVNVNFDWGWPSTVNETIKKTIPDGWNQNHPIFWLVRSPPACHRNPFVLEKPGHGGMARLHASDFRSFSQLEHAMRHGGFWNDHGWLGALGLENALIGEGFSQDGSPQPSSLTLPQINIDSIRLDICNCQGLS